MAKCDPVVKRVILTVTELRAIIKRVDELLNDSWDDIYPSSDEDEHQVTIWEDMEVEVRLKAETWYDEKFTV